jgi:hypothetical protein
MLAFIYLFTDYLTVLCKSNGQILLRGISFELWPENWLTQTLPCFLQHLQANTGIIYGLVDDHFVPDLVR